ncbi:MAG: hypothetical protein U0361_06420 [Nitrospiraceae bacterium]
MTHHAVGDHDHESEQGDESKHKESSLRDQSVPFMFHFNVDQAMDVDQDADRTFQALDRVFVLALDPVLGFLAASGSGSTGAHRAVKLRQVVQSVGDLGHRLVLTIGQIRPVRAE